jgi:N-acetylglucosaminyldiphosphoundecaprenol N-acetyl-beta-D-mannosaminyltransferase
MQGAPPRKPPASAPVAARSCRILGLRVDATSYAGAADAIVAMARGDGGMTCVATVHMVMEAFDAPDYQRLVNAAELVTPDGVPLVWALRALGIGQATRVYGPDLMPLLCARAEALSLPVGFYGGSPQVLETLLERLLARFPGLRIGFAHSPPYRPASVEEDLRVCESIRDAGVRLLFVGLGCPKQERWMAAHREALPCAMVGVGAAFDFLAGHKRQAPAFLQRAGLEWLFRLATEPRRLWRRYVVHNPRFVLRFARQLMGRRVS